MTAATPTPGASFLRRRSTRVVLGAASVAGFTLLGAAPAFAATAADCTPGNTVDSASGDATDIQALIDANTAIICLSGTFDVDTTLVFDYDLTLFGLADAVLDGGGDTRILAADGGDSIEVENIVFQNGSADGDGGAINAYNVTAINSVFSSNEATGDGGAISAYNVDSLGSVFVGNESEGFGGAIFAYETAEVENSTFSDNGADVGGAIFAYTSVSSIASTFESNSAEVGGAILADDELWVENSTFVGNAAGFDGGAILAGAGTILQSTFLDNTTGDNGQSVFAWADEVFVRGNIFAGSTTAAHLGSNEEDVITDLGGNLFSTTEAQEPAFTAAPATGFGIATALFFDGATLADNGGPTQTVALYSGSPAINAVPAGSPSVTVDQRGVPRDALSDAGAYEWQGAISPDSPTLAATGSAFEAWATATIAAATGLLAAGAAVLALGRRRRA